MAKETTTNPDLNIHLVPATLTQRMNALLIDRFIIFIGLMLFFWGLNFLLEIELTSKLAFWLLYFSIVFLYHYLFELYGNGQTIGKKWMHICVVNDQGDAINSKQAWLRNIWRIIDILPALYICGLLIASKNNKNKRLGDKRANSIVIREESIPIPLAHEWLRVGFHTHTEYGAQNNLHTKAE